MPSRSTFSGSIRVGKVSLTAEIINHLTILIQDLQFERRFILWRVSSRASSILRRRKSGTYI